MAGCLGMAQQGHIVPDLAVSRKWDMPMTLVPGWLVASHVTAELRGNRGCEKPIDGTVGSLGDDGHLIRPWSIEGLRAVDAAGYSLDDSRPWKLQ